MQPPKISRRFHLRGWDERVISALASSCTLAPETFSDRAELEAQMARALETLRTQYPGVVFSAPTISERDDRFVATWESRPLGGLRRTHVTSELVGLRDWRELVRIHAVWRDLAGNGPVTIAFSKDEPSEVDSMARLVDRVESEGKKGWNIQRYKGLGEMNPGQLWETTLDATRRTLRRVTLTDLHEAEEAFSVLMGDNVEVRREFIEANALNVENLDI
jgi:DNA gyrase subunit B